MLVFPTEINTKMGQESQKHIVRIPLRGPRSTPDLTLEETRAKIAEVTLKLSHTRLLMVLGLMEILEETQRAREARENQPEN